MEKRPSNSLKSAYISQIGYCMMNVWVGWRPSGLHSVESSSTRLNHQSIFKRDFMAEVDNLDEQAVEVADREQLLALLRTMLVIRRTEEQLAKCHQRGLIHGACHTYIGEEAIASGVCAHLNSDDVVFSTHRGHGHALAKGVPSRQVVAELFGREGGCSRGRGGSMHLFSPEVGMMGTSGIVGPSILQATGAGYSFKMLKTDQVAVAFFGDGAVNNGAFHEGMNLSSIWDLPVLLVCENNQFATEVPFSYSSSNPDVGTRGRMYAMEGTIVDGNNVLAVYAAAMEAIQRARAGGGPTLFECKTYRTRSHAEGMPDFGYRTQQDVDAWKQRCPIERMKTFLLDQTVVSPEDIEDIEDDVREIAREAVQFAEQSSYPSSEFATTHIYFEGEATTNLPARPRSPEVTSDCREIPIRRPIWRRWPRIPPFLSWARAWALGAATSIRPLAFTIYTAQCDCVTRRLPSVDLSACRLEPR